MANSRRPSERTAKSKSAAENQLDDPPRALTRADPGKRAIDAGPVKVARALRK